MFRRFQQPAGQRMKAMLTVGLAVKRVVVQPVRSTLQARDIARNARAGVDGPLRAVGMTVCGVGACLIQLWLSVVRRSIPRGNGLAHGERFC